MREMIKQQVYSAVRVKDENSQRNGQIGTFVGAGDAPDESLVKFEGATPISSQKYESIKDDTLEAV